MWSPFECGCFDSFCHDALNVLVDAESASMVLMARLFRTDHPSPIWLLDFGHAEKMGSVRPTCPCISVPATPLAVCVHCTVASIWMTVVGGCEIVVVMLS
jgi:hypothetical protein